MAAGLFNNQALLKFNRIDNRVAILFYERLISPRLLCYFKYTSGKEEGWPLVPRFHTPFSPVPKSSVT